MLGFTIRKDEELEGLQIVTYSGMAISMWGIDKSDDTTVQFKECAVAISQPIPEFQDDFLTEILGISTMENITPMVMEKMGYAPSAKEIENQMFFVNISKYFEIVEFVKKLEVLQRN